MKLCNNRWVLGCIIFLLVPLYGRADYIGSFHCFLGRSFPEVILLAIDSNSPANAGLQSELDKSDGTAPEAEKIKFWLTKGADPNAPSPDGKLPLLFAILRADTRQKGGPRDEKLTTQWNKVIEVLLDGGADPNTGMSRNNQLGRPNFNPLMAACAHSLTDTATLLLRYKVDVNIQCEGMTALAYAVREENAILVNQLLSNGADINAGTSTPLHLAAQGGALKMVEILVAHKCEMNLKNKEGYTPLGLALRLYRSRMQENADSTKQQRENLKWVIDFLRSHGAVE